MKLNHFCKQVEDWFLKSENKSLNKAQPVSGLLLLREPSPTFLTCMLYEPIICLILQGQKEIYTHESQVVLNPGESLVVSHDIPVHSRITKANSQNPYLAVVVCLDIKILRGLYEEIGGLKIKNSISSSLTVQTTDDRIIDVLSRYLQLANDSIECRVLLDSLRRELHFRLLTTPHGEMLRNLQNHVSNASNITRVIAYIRTHFRKTILISELAQEVGLSQAALYKHFKRITQTTPIQFQKDLRLLEARQLLQDGVKSVSETAFAVGYESPSQFSREYNRKFGISPSKEILENNLS